MSAITERYNRMTALSDVLQKTGSHVAASLVRTAADDLMRMHLALVRIVDLTDAPRSELLSVDVARRLNGIASSGLGPMAGGREGRFSMRIPGNVEVKT